MQDHITLAQAAKRCPGRPSANAVWRWCRKGIKSRSGQQIRLNHVRVGGRIFTDPKSLQEFFAEVAEADREHFSRPTELHRNLKSDTPSQRRRSVEQAERELTEAGI